VRIRTENVTWQEIDGELVILDLQTSAYLTTNVVGTALAKYLTEERTPADLTTFLMSTYDIDEQTARQDSQVFVDQLRSKSLLIEPEIG
jgi:coenzyme PQQ synthesis protein D (PqqD)